MYMSPVSRVECSVYEPCERSITSALSQALRHEYFLSAPPPSLPETLPVPPAIASAPERALAIASMNNNSKYSNILIHETNVDMLSKISVTALEDGLPLKKMKLSDLL